MASVWLAAEGNSPTPGQLEPRWQLSLSDCEATLGLTIKNYLCDLSKGPQFGPVDKLRGIRHPRHVVVEISETEATSHGWKPGFYLAPVSVADAMKKLP